MDNSPAYLMVDLMSRVVSPYSLNMPGKNSLHGILEQFIDFNDIAMSPIHVFVTATNVHTGRGRVFRNDAITTEVLLASACLPSMFQAVEIDGDFYWDGGYSGNPTLTPLVRHCKADDMILIPINPIERAEVPRTASEIINRLNEISFNAVALKELRMIAMLRKVVDCGDSEGAKWARLRLHRVSNDIMNTLGASSKVITEWPFLTMLRDEGRKSAQAFLDAHGGDLGKRSTLDIDALLEGV
jgi:NTE family protein